MATGLRRVCISNCTVIGGVLNKCKIPRYGLWGMLGQSTRKGSAQTPGERGDNETNLCGLCASEVSLLTAPTGLPGESESKDKENLHRRGAEKTEHDLQETRRS